MALLRQKCKDVNKMPKSGRKQKPWCLCLFLEFSELIRIAIAGHHPQYISTAWVWHITNCAALALTPRMTECADL